LFPVGTVSKRRRRPTSTARKREGRGSKQQQKETAVKSSTKTKQDQEKRQDTLTRGLVVPTIYRQRAARPGGGPVSRDGARRRARRVMSLRGKDRTSVSWRKRVGGRSALIEEACGVPNSSQTPREPLFDWLLLCEIFGQATAGRHKKPPWRSVALSRGGCCRRERGIWNRHARPPPGSGGGVLISGARVLTAEGSSQQKAAWPALLSFPPITSFLGGLFSGQRGWSAAPQQAFRFDPTPARFGRGLCPADRLVVVTPCMLLQFPVSDHSLRVMVGLTTSPPHSQQGASRTYGRGQGGRFSLPLHTRSKRPQPQGAHALSSSHTANQPTQTPASFGPPQQQQTSRMATASAAAAAAAHPSRRRRRGGDGPCTPASSSSSSPRPLWSVVALALALLLAAAAPAAQAQLQQQRALRGKAAAATSCTKERPCTGGDSAAGAARNKTTVTTAVPPHKVGRISVPNAERGMTLSRIAYGSLHFPEFEGACVACLRMGLICPRGEGG
jgi:hypothetical protein